jgi:molecular chaperone GrpE
MADQHGAAPPGDRGQQPGQPLPPDETMDVTADLKAQVAELEDRWRRAVADLDNMRKRFVREAEQMRADERARVAALWLPVLDNLELALSHAEADPAAIVDGVRGVRDQALEVLSRLGFPRRTDEGTPFDPGRHEAVAVLPAVDTPAGTVVQVVRPGYGSAEQLLRPAAVVVAKGD